MSTDAPLAGPGNNDSTARPHVRLRLREVLSLVSLAVLLGVAAGYLIAAHVGLDIAARVIVSDMIVGLPGTWVAIVVLRRLARIERELSERFDAWMAGYNQGYIDRIKQEHGH